MSESKSVDAEVRHLRAEVKDPGSKMKSIHGISSEARAAPRCNTKSISRAESVSEKGQRRIGKGSFRASGESNNIAECH